MVNSNVIQIFRSAMNMQLEPVPLNWGVDGTSASPFQASCESTPGSAVPQTLECVQSHPGLKDSHRYPTLTRSNYTYLACGLGRGIRGIIKYSVEVFLSELIRSDGNIISTKVMGGKQSRSLSNSELNEVSVGQRRKGTMRDEQPSLSWAAERIRKQTSVHFGFSTLSFAMRGLDETPAELWELQDLQKLNLSMNCLCSLPPALGSLDNLVILNLLGNNLSSLPPEIGLLKKLRVLFACRNRLSEVPEELGSCTCLEVLSLANNQISSLPSSLAAMHHLTKLNLSHNRIVHIPTCVYSMKGLVFLHLACNRLETIADQIQDLVNLKILIVEGNSIHTLPKTLCFLDSLELLNVDFNELQNVPDEMYQLSRLRRLACHPLDKGLHIIHNPLLKPIHEVLQASIGSPSEAGGVDASACPSPSQSGLRRSLYRPDGAQTAAAPLSELNTGPLNPGVIQESGLTHTFLLQRVQRRSRVRYSPPPYPLLPHRRTGDKGPRSHFRFLHS
ncbi:hypothetical protein CCH79_00009652 [Gambusia affinis]|uniref:Leucine-rich repeat-containing protein 30 n=1 Tax=Gambusia affinis TaxID=33528 RepID=A0A315W5B6_GAMAF|nr:hypothetical protein CCH79_00009652 [Gambusia affinis]